MTRTQEAHDQFSGDIAEKYDRKRARSKAWRAEYAAVAELLSHYPPHTTLLDVPTGTLRFMHEFMNNCFHVYAIDSNPDMLSIAASKLDSISAHYIELQRGNILSLDIPDKYVDVSLCVRLISLLDHADVVKALQELQRVTRHQIIISNREPTETNTHKYSVPRQLILDNLSSDWKLHNVVKLHHSDFWLYTLSNTNYVDTCNECL